VSPCCHPDDFVRTLRFVSRILLFFIAERDQAQKTSKAIGMIDGDLSDEQRFIESGQLNDSLRCSELFPVIHAV